eukprot:m51a1_g9239 hypothetical protein (203) ;mRNA; f:109229-110414
MQRKATQVKELTDSSFLWVQQQWDTAASDKSYILANAQQVLPGTVIAEEFEEGRTRLEETLRARGQRLLTRQLWCAPPNEYYSAILENGFFGGFRGATPTFHEDPTRAIALAAVPPTHVFLCRCALGVEGQDWKTTRNGVYTINTHTVLPSFSATWRKLGAHGAEEPAAAPVVEEKLCPSCVQSCPMTASFCPFCGTKFVST